ncbi:MAG: GNAT family N-acetyltransferase [Nanoarchaeota archaeon]|nr:GNAT family N-acetyltransferase [Nanoarchaeota archaeon]
MKIRKYLPKDRLDVIKIINKNLIETFGSYRKEDEWENFSDYKKNGGVFYVAEDKGKLIGTIALENHKTYGELKRLYVITEYQGKGTADKLYQELIEFCNKKGITKIILKTNNKRERAKAFYRKKGFRKIKEVNNHSRFYLKIES